MSLVLLPLRIVQTGFFYWIYSTVQLKIFEDGLASCECEVVHIWSYSSGIWSVCFREIIIIENPFFISDNQIEIIFQYYHIYGLGSQIVLLRDTFISFFWRLDFHFTSTNSVAQKEKTKHQQQNKTVFSTLGRFLTFFPCKCYQTTPNYFSTTFNHTSDRESKHASIRAC